MEKVIISIDAGGTSTRYAIIDKDKNLIKTYEGLPGSPAINANAENDIFFMLCHIYEDIKNDYELCGMVFGMSGFALVHEKEFIARLIDKFHTNIFMDHDAYLALYSIMQDKYQNGVVVISGTGSAIFGKNSDLRFMSSGWGQLLTERGSAYASVKDFVCKLIHEKEETGDISSLGKKFMNYLHFEKLEDFKPLFYLHKKDEVAKNSIFFKVEADKGNQEAIDWLYYNGTLLGLDSASCAKRVNINKDIVIGFRGGFVQNSKYVINGCLDTLKEKGFNPIVIEGDLNPVYGGYYIAKERGFF